MHAEEHKKWLEERGILSVWVVMRRLKCTSDFALRILQSIVDENENIYFLKHGMIVIKGFEPKRK